MKHFILTVLLALFFQASVDAQCSAEPTITNAVKILKTRTLDLTSRCEAAAPSSCEVSLVITAGARGTSWAKKGAEAVALDLFVDGKYNQTLLLFAGEKKFSYEVFVGALNDGKHQIALTFNQARSAVKDSAAVTIEALTLRLFSPAEVLKPAQIRSGADGDASAKKNKEIYFAEKYAPFIYARPNTIDKFSDIPLLTYYEILPKTNDSYLVRYTTIFTNEDGGTQSAALMARWGRMTDIEWIYEIEVKDDRPVSEIYQAANHLTKNFDGKRAFGEHPLIADVTDNNNFSDAGCSELRFAPKVFQADLTGGSRETVMDKSAWTYRLMAEEAEREGRVDGAKLSANTIDDLRDYLYVETFAENNNAAVSLELTDEGRQTGQSDWNNAFLRVDRSGYFRIAVRLPNAAKSKPATIALQCHAAAAPAKIAAAACQNAQIIKIWRLDQDFTPRAVAFETRPAANLKSGENLTYIIKNQSK